MGMKILIGVLCVIAGYVTSHFMRIYWSGYDNFLNANSSYVLVIGFLLIVSSFLINKFCIK